MPSFRRRIELQRHPSPNGGQVRAVLEDDYHHFRVEVRYRGGHVTSVWGEAPRPPFVTCPDAAAALNELAGMALDRVSIAVTRYTDAAQQCTHMFDLAGLAIAVAAREIDYRHYEVDVPRHVEGRSHARLVRDDGFRLEWDVENSTILSPAPYKGVNMRNGMARWALTSLSEDEAEAALVLRRCALISIGRLKDIDKETHAHLTGHCYSQQPQRAPMAIRIVGSTWDFTHRPEVLCLDDREWLNGFTAA